MVKEKNEGKETTKVDKDTLEAKDQVSSSDAEPFASSSMKGLEIVRCKKEKKDKKAKKFAKDLQRKDMSGLLRI